MCVYIYIYVYVYIYIYICNIYIYIYTHYAYIYIYTQIYICIFWLRTNEVNTNVAPAKAMKLGGKSTNKYQTSPSVKDIKFAVTSLMLTPVHVCVHVHCMYVCSHACVYVNM